MNTNDRKASLVAELRRLAYEIEADDCDLRDAEMRVDVGIASGTMPYRDDGLRTYTIRLVTYKSARDHSA